MVLTWDLLNNKFVSFKTDKRWEITGIPIKVPEDITPKFAELLHEVLYRKPSRLQQYHRFGARDRSGFERSDEGYLRFA